VTTVETDPLEDELRRTRAELAEARAELAAFRAERVHADAVGFGSELLQVGIFLSSEDGRIVDVNPAFCDITGYAAEELIGESSALLLFPEHRDAALAAMNAPPDAAADVVSGVTALRHRSGERRYVRGRARWNTDGQRRLLVSALVDVTAQRNADREAARLAALLDASPDAILSADLDRRITSWSKGAERLYGYTAAEMIGQLPDVLIGEGDRRAADRLWEASLGQAQFLNDFETYRLARDGRRVPVSITGFALRDESGNVVGGAAIHRDIPSVSKRRRRSPAWPPSSRPRRMPS